MTELRIVVLDALDWKFVSEHPNVMPCLTSIGELGARALLRACDPPVTSEAAAALLTGREVAMPWHDASSAPLVRERPWIDHVTAQGVGVGICNVPMTWPAFTMPGGAWLTGGYPVGGPDRMFAGLLPNDVAGYPTAGLMQDRGPGGGKDLQSMARTEAELVAWFLGKAPRRDLEILWLRSSDNAAHHAWGTLAYEEALVRLDEQLPNLAQGARNLLVISDHGADALEDERCAAYRACYHGPHAKAAGLPGGHSEEGVLFGLGPVFANRGLLEPERLVEVARGAFEVLGIPSAPGMPSTAPRWAART